MDAKWIWLNKDIYPNRQKTWVSFMSRGDFIKKNPDLPTHTVGEFQKSFIFRQTPQTVTLRVCANTSYRLYVNDILLGDGPDLPGGDWLTHSPLDWRFYNTYTLTPETDVLSVRAFVRLEPDKCNEYSDGQGGFYLSGSALFSDGYTETFGTDSSWLCRLDARSVSTEEYDFSRISDPFTGASETEDTGEPIPSPGKPLQLLPVLPCGALSAELSEGESAEFSFDRIYAAKLGLHADGACTVLITTREVPDKDSGRERITFDKAGDYRGTALYSVGELTVTVEKGSARVQPILWYSRYPVEREGSLHTSDNVLDLVWSVCKNTLEICRQSTHLDSPLHQEMLACTGDYYIESLGTVMAFGDLSLAQADICRTARWLIQNKGQMFHTTYSLIWVQWIRKAYEFTADKSTAAFCFPALCTLLDRFLTYVDETGLVGNPPDYMFVDWMMIEGFSMHHPPKALGQSVLNAFYYKALIDGAYIAELLGETKRKEQWLSLAEKLKVVFNALLFDKNRGLYIDGLATPTQESQWQPANPDLIHFSKYPNALAVSYGLCPEEYATEIAQKVWEKGNGLGEVQPYFMHFIYEMADKTGLLQRTGLAAFDDYRPLVEASPKGLQEGWFAPTPGYHFDYSHAWGGSPLYHLPKLLLGLRVLEPGWKRIALSPKLCGLSFAEISIPTPCGFLTVEMREGEKPVISVPKGIDAVID